jgi:hypothetical protein
MVSLLSVCYGLLCCADQKTITLPVYVCSSLNPVPAVYVCTYPFLFAKKAKSTGYPSITYVYPSMYPSHASIAHLPIHPIPSHHTHMHSSWSHVRPGSLGGQFGECVIPRLGSSSASDLPAKGLASTGGMFSPASRSWHWDWGGARTTCPPTYMLTD